MDSINFKEKYKIYILSGALVFIFYTLFSYIFSGEQGRVRRFILRGRQAVESKNIFACANMISTDYHDKYGNDRQSLIYAAKQFFGYYGKISIHIDNIKIELDGAKRQASAEITALVIGQTSQDNEEKILEGEKGRFKIKLIKKDKKWQVLELEFFEPIRVMGLDVS